MGQDAPTPTKQPQQVRRMFGRIVRRYDLLNGLMSLGMDTRWRRLAATAARPAGGLALDLGAGTGDLTLELASRGAAQVVGADFSPEMLAVARTKAASGASANVTWTLADALRLPFPEETFDCVTNAFLLRNLANLREGLSEMARVLKPGGRLVCLDMTQPPPGPFGALYRLYFNRVMPPLAGMLSGDRHAYSYLPNSLHGFPDAPTLSGLITDAGLVQVQAQRLAGGTVALHTALKPPFEA
ncbi:MAG: bifunctional demethylmenaquinone methyltransferase/2-methoxy-6-polyprenyl-1,4-benzoquinol methylase UbiE [Chloroflexi bacterium]|nr:bifunctional demethylmenaquinone methyltransferase/2-methoxy-6-polyprenyl-1,4-benzoquinol methylase UbiE [Chloroflexota bacterium]